MKLACRPSMMSLIASGVFFLTKKDRSFGFDDRLQIHEAYLEHPSQKTHPLLGMCSQGGIPVRNPGHCVRVFRQLLPPPPSAPPRPPPAPRLETPMGSFGTIGFCQSKSAVEFSLEPLQTTTLNGSICTRRITSIWRGGVIFRQHRLRIRMCMH